MSVGIRTPDGLARPRLQLLFVRTLRIFCPGLIAKDGWPDSPSFITSELSTLLGAFAELHLATAAA